MATKIVTKNSSTAGAAPTATDLVQGELAVNVADKRLYTEDNAGAIVELGTNPYNFTANHNGSAKLATTSTGIDVTGTATMDGLVVAAANPDVYITSADTGQADLYFGGTTSPTKGRIQYSDNSDWLRLWANSIKHIELGGNGDISFYEDTGTTAKFFWDASAESLGIGTSSPSEALHISGGGLLIDSNIPNAPASGTSGFIADYVSNATRFWSRGDATTRGSYEFKMLENDGGNQIDAMVIDSSGNVGIGTTAPSKQLHQIRTGNASDLPTLAAETGFITQSTNATASSQNISIFSGNIGEGRLFFGDTDDEDIGSIIYNHASNYLTFGTNATERARIASNGDLLVNTTASGVWGNATQSVNDNGHSLRNDGIQGSSAYKASANVGYVQYLNRTGSDGGITAFYKNGDPVGSIGTQGSRLTIGNGDTGLRIAGDLNTIVPWNTTTNLLSDSAIDLGRSNQRFKDLYLSGGVYLGGTGAANKLDDYETGTFTPTVISGVGSPVYAGRDGGYTKIGDLVYFQFRLDLSSGTAASSQFKFGGLPFTSQNVANYGGAWISYSLGFLNNLGTASWHVGPSNTQVFAYKPSDGATMTGIEIDAVGNILGNVYVNGVYRAA